MIYLQLGAQCCLYINSYTMSVINSNFIKSVVIWRYWKELVTLQDLRFSQQCC
jgi:hypothetical protein